MEQSFFEFLDRGVLGKYYEDYNYGTIEKIEYGATIVPLVVITVFYPLLGMLALTLHFCDRGLRNFNWNEYDPPNLPTTPKIIYRMGRAVKELFIQNNFIYGKPRIPENQEKSTILT